MYYLMPFLYMQQLQPPPPPRLSPAEVHPRGSSRDHESGSDPCGAHPALDARTQRVLKTRSLLRVRQYLVGF